MQSGKNIHIEPYAINSPVQLIPLPALRLVMISDFASYAIKNFGQEYESKIGTYYCNRIYLWALRWGDSNGNRPVVFVHVPVMGNRNHHAKQIIRLLSLMKKHISEMKNGSNHYQ
jgi:hypothetical protein